MDSNSDQHSNSQPEEPKKAENQNVDNSNLHTASTQPQEVPAQKIMPANSKDESNNAKPIRTPKGYLAATVGTLIGFAVGTAFTLIMSLILLLGSAGALFFTCGDACNSKSSINLGLIIGMVLIAAVYFVCIYFGCYLGLKVKKYSYAKETAVVLVLLTVGLSILFAILEAVLSKLLGVGSDSGSASGSAVGMGNLLAIFGPFISRYLVLKRKSAHQIRKPF